MVSKSKFGYKLKKSKFHQHNFCSFNRLVILSKIDINVNFLALNTIKWALAHVLPIVDKFAVLLNNQGGELFLTSKIHAYHAPKNSE